MMKRFSLIALISFVCALPLLMAPSGGFPSRPTFQQTTVRSPTATEIQYETDAAADEKSYLQEASSGIWVLGTAADATPTVRVANVILVDRTGTTPSLVELAATTVRANGSFETPSQVNFLTGISGFHAFVNRNAAARGYKWYTGASGTSNTMTLDTGGRLTVIGTLDPATTFNGANGGKMAAALINGVGACSVIAGALNTTGCVRSGVGVYRVNFSGSFGLNNPACNASINNSASTALTISVQTFNANSKNVRIQNAAGAATDSNFEIVCVGT